MYIYTQMVTLLVIHGTTAQQARVRRRTETLVVLDGADGVLLALVDPGAVAKLGHPAATRVVRTARVQHPVHVLKKRAVHVYTSLPGNQTRPAGDYTSHFSSWSLTAGITSLFEMSIDDATALLAPVSIT